MKVPEWLVASLLVICVIACALAQGIRKVSAMTMRVSERFVSSLLATGMAVVVGAILTSISYDRAVAFGAQHKEMYSWMAYASFAATFMSFVVFVIIMLGTKSKRVAVQAN